MKDRNGPRRAATRRFEAGPAGQAKLRNPSRWPANSVRLVLVLCILGGLAFLAWTQWPAPPVADARPNILLVTLDTVRADRIGAYGHGAAETPNLDSLAREGVRFADATSQAPLTGPAHAALLTAQYPGRLGIKNNAAQPLPEEALTLAEALKAEGYRTAAYIGAFVVDRAYGFGQGFDLFDSAFAGFRQRIKEQVQRPASEVVDPALEWLKGGQSAAPFFAWVHLYDAHTPYAAPPPYGQRFADRPYDGEVAYVDAQVGRLISQLRSSGELDRTVVIVVGDHGESLGEHGEDDHGIFLYESVMRIPWIMRLPSNFLLVAGRPESGTPRGLVISEQVRSVDVMPTLLDLAGVRIPHGQDGESLTGLLRGIPRPNPPASYSESWYPKLHFGWSRLRALRSAEWKYIEAPKPELYDLRADRAEGTNVVGERGSVAAQMAAELEGIEKSFGARAAAATPKPDPETIARLRSLGYIGLAASGSGSAEGPDPKDKILEFKEFRALLTQANDELARGGIDRAIDMLERALRLNDQAYDAHVILGSAWQQKGNLQRALDEFEAASLMNPAAAAPHLLAANALLIAGRFDQAMAKADGAAVLEPLSGEVASMRGRIFEHSGRGPEALAAYQRAVALNSSDPSARGRLAGIAMLLKHYDIAEAQLRILLGLNYQPSRTHFALGNLAEVRGNPYAAAEEYRRALALEPGFTPARDALSKIERAVPGRR